MKPGMNEPCAICRKQTATAALPMAINFMGKQMPLITLLCDECFLRNDRDELLAAYTESIFCGGVKQ